MSVENAATIQAAPRAGVVRPFHSLVWLAWLVAAVAAVGSNPLLNALVIAQAVLVALACHTANPVGRAFSLFVRLGLVLLVIRAVLSLVPVGGYSYGSTLLWTLPTIQLPIWLGGLQLGGAATLEMLGQGIVGGVRLWALILVFGAFNAVGDHYGLLRRTPRFLFHAGLATTIALTFVPQVILQIQAIRDAQRIRGHRFRTWRDALPLIVPLLSGGLERSIQLAEAMDSRGYGHTLDRHRAPLWAQMLTILGLALLALGLYWGFAAGAWQGWIGALIGAGVALITLHWLSRGTHRTRYVQEHWHRRDAVVMLASVAVLVGVTLLRVSRTGGLVYSTLPRISVPPFVPLTGALYLLLSVPAVIQLLNLGVPDERRRTHRSHLADRAQ